MYVLGFLIAFVVGRHTTGPAILRLSVRSWEGPVREPVPRVTVSVAFVSLQFRFDLSIIQ